LSDELSIDGSQDHGPALGPSSRQPQHRKELEMPNLLNGMMADAKSLILGAIVLMAMAFVIMTWARTRSLVPTLGSLLLGAVVIAGVARYSTIKDQVDKDITRYTNTTTPPLGG
jgi:hypothetical protein